MKVIISKTLNDSLIRLDAQSQAAAKQAVFDYQVDPARPGLQKHRIDNTKDKGFWSLRVTRDIRLIIHEQGDVGVVCYVDHHDAAYKWAERRRLEVHPQTGAAQFVAIDERVEEVVKRIIREVEEEPPLFKKYEKDYLLDLGVPVQWLDHVRIVGKSKLDTLIDLLPEEAVERLFELAEGRPVPRPVKVDTKDPFAHPDAQRRFRIIDSAEELKLALAAPWEKWIVFLHPSQRAAVEKQYAGPAKVSGGAGTGKTVVAMHRAAHLLRANPKARVLLTTFSTTLASRLQQSTELLLPPGSAERERLTIVNLHKLARDVWTRVNKRNLKILEADVLKRHIDQALRGAATQNLSHKFLKGEWEVVVQPNGVKTWEQYKSVPRTGRGVPLGAKQRKAVWGVLERVVQSVSMSGFLTWDRVCHEVAEHVRHSTKEQFDHVIADEVQDFGLADLMLLRALAAEGTNDLFLCGDIGQRIFKGRSPWIAAGIETRGRSTKLRLNYRTTEQIQRLADRFLGGKVQDNDGDTEERDTLSLLNGPEPEVAGYDSSGDEAQALSEWVLKLTNEGFQHRDIAIFARSEALVGELAENALESISVPWASLKDEDALAQGAVAVGTMHRAKGLEFKAVAMVGCNKATLPSPAALKDLDDPADLDSAKEQERNLLYVACSRARERLLLSYSGQPSEFIKPFMAKSNNR